MENKQKKLLLLAEDVLISEESKLDPIFLTVDVKLCDSVVNKNREGTTEAFIADVVNRPTDHMCLPFYADKKNLLAGNFEQLGHLYNKVTKKFGTDQIGAMSEFYSETDEDGVVSLYGKIRIPKRDRDIVYRLVDLYEMGRFAVSVELSYNPKDVVLSGGGKLVDVSENNALTGLCLVWRPACEDAYALDMVAEEEADDSEEIVAESEEPAERGETSPMNEENKLTTAEETTITVDETEDRKITVAEGEGASESGGEDASETGGEGASESGGEGASEGGEGASESGAEASEGGGEGASEGGGAGASGDDDGGEDEGDDVGTDALTVDHDEDERKNSVAESDNANAEVLEHSVDTHESVDNSGWYGDKPVHIIEYHERVIETMDEAGALIAELESKIVELEEIKGKYDAIVAEQEAQALAEKRENAKAFAEKQGLNVTDVAVAEAIEKLDYEKIAELTMASDEKPETVVPVKPEISLASFVSVEISNDNFGGLLARKSKN